MSSGSPVVPLVVVRRVLLPPGPWVPVVLTSPLVLSVLSSGLSVAVLSLLVLLVFASVFEAAVVMSSGPWVLVNPSMRDAATI